MLRACPNILQYYRVRRNVSFFIILCVTCLVLHITWSKYSNNFQEDTIIFDGHLPMNTKYILLWNSKEFEPLSCLGYGQKAFVDHNCSKTNCFVTSNRRFFGDVTRFDAIAFNGRFMQELYYDLPKYRSPHQKYIYFNTESADNYPVCDDWFDGFFNLTATYKLDSDIVYSYILIRDIEGNIVGPKADMVWKEDVGIADEELSYKIQNKSKAAAWFVSNCWSLSRRDKFVRKLQAALKPYDLSVDVYGSCGPYKCPIEKKADCYAKLEKYYYFYLSLENSFADDYVTEKLLTALKHYTVPVVFGGANYSRFLPPTSYINGREHTPQQLAFSMAKLIWSSNLYKNYFKWKNHYTYHKVQSEKIICGVCAALNSDVVPHVYEKFREWWNPHFEAKCSKWFYF